MRWRWINSIQYVFNKQFSWVKIIFQLGGKNCLLIKIFTIKSTKALVYKKQREKDRKHYTRH